MAENFFGLSPADRKEALEVAASESGRPAYVLEKDAWVVWTLAALFRASFGGHLVFKGGTSLSKIYKAIDRFSEDIDVTYDIRAIAEDLVKGAGKDALPASRSQAGKWREKIDERLATWLKAEVLPHIEASLKADKIDAKARADTETIHIEYPTEVKGYGYVAPTIKIEFGARSTGEPVEEVEAACDAAPHLRNLVFPATKCRVMRVERTAWEKMTAIHVFCLQGKIKDQLARHWYDVAKLDEAGRIDAALKDRDVAKTVADHKTLFFSAKDAKGNSIDYAAAINGGLHLIPEGEDLKALEADYGKMVEGRMFIKDPEPLKWILERCEGVQKRANAAAEGAKPQKMDRPA